jgi:hypothetical protein
VSLRAKEAAARSSAIEKRSPNRLMEARRPARVRRRFLIEFTVGGVRHTGFTQDVSLEGLFVCSVRRPSPGTTVLLRLQTSGGDAIPLRGVVVRTFRAPSVLSSVVPTGFGVRLSEPAPESYLKLFRGLEGGHATK